MSRKQRIWVLLLLVSMALLTVAALAEGVMPMASDDTPHLHSAVCDNPTYCTLCGQTFDPDTDPHEELAHITKDPWADDGQGNHYRYCVCKEELRSLPHTRNCNQETCRECELPYDGPSISYHVDNQEKYDTEYHWMECGSCNTITDKEKHYRSDCRAKTCSACGQSYTGDNTTHGASITVSSATEHWLACSLCNEERGERASHSNTSGYQTDGTKHYKYCDTCDYELESGVHIAADGGMSGTCTVCGVTFGSTQPEETTGPESTDKPEETTGPESTDKPEETAGPEPTDKPEETAGPESTDKPEETAGPEPTDKPEETTAPESTDKPEETAGPEPTDKPEETAEPKEESTDAPVVTEIPEATDAPVETPAPATPEVPEASATPVGTELPKATATPKAATASSAAATSQPAAGDDSFLSRFRSNSSAAANGELFSGEVDETITLTMEASIEEASYIGSVLTVYATDSRADGVALSLSSQYESESLLLFRPWQEATKEISALRETTDFCNFVELAEALMQALLPESSADEVDAIIVAILQSGFDGTLESTELNLDEDIDGEIAGYLAQNGYEFFLVLQDENVSLLVRELN